MIRINLLSDREAVRKESSRKQLSIYVLSICALALILVGVQTRFYVKKKKVETDIRNVTLALQQLEERVGKVEEYKLSKKELETKLNVIRKLQSGQMWVPLMLDSLGQTLPERMWIEKLDLKGTRLSMEGYAIDDQTIADFMRSLEATPFFPGVELELSEKKAVEGVGMKYFSLVASVDPSAAAPVGTEAGGRPASAEAAVPMNTP